LKMGNDGKEINISGGFVGYGLIKSDYLLLEGSVPGPSNRLIMLRTAIRPFNVSPVQIKEIAK
ncbi:MAG TPA: 50S ribosomal protein L3, partial [archaeon]|nr:50S ribosomal protein L3 [archaeon]